MSSVSDVDLTRFCVSIQSDEKSRRKQALEDLKKKMFDSGRVSTRLEISETWEIVKKHLAKSLTDSAESCRNLSVELWKSFLELLPVTEKNISYLIPILTRRLSFQELQEPSEEVRLNYVCLLRYVIAKYKDHLPAYSDDLVAILSRTVTDSYPGIKRESSICIEEFASSVPTEFYSRSETFVKPILGNFTHQHYKVRVASVRAIGQVMLHGNSKSMEEVSTPLAQRLFDQSGAVRLAVIEVAGRWFVELRDRYSWWSKLIPLLVTGLHDDVEEIRTRAAQLWDEAGKLYMQENESDEKFKDKMDFLTRDPQHYPGSKGHQSEKFKRPNLGCRVIVQRNLGRLLCGVVREISDWLADIRVRSAQLLCVLVLNAEQDITQHIEKLLPAMYRACNDEDPRVGTNVELAAEYMGYFVPPSVYCRLILPTLEDVLTSGHLRVFAAILRGSEPSGLIDELSQIGRFLRQPHVCRSKKPNYQKQLLACCESIIKVCNEGCSDISEDLFVILFTLLATCREESSVDKVEYLLEKLADIEKMSLAELYCCDLRSILMPLKDSCKNWTIHSDELSIFRACLERVPSTTAVQSVLVIPILKETMSVEADPELRLKLFIILAEYFQPTDDVSLHVSKIRRLGDSVLRDVVLPGLVWTAGRTAEAIRTAAVCCLCAILENRTSMIKRRNDESSKNDENVKLNDENAKLNDENVKLFHENVKLNDENVKLNDGNVKLNDENVTLNDENVRLNDENVKLNDENVKLNDENPKFNDENLNCNEKNVGNPKTNAIIEFSAKNPNYRDELDPIPNLTDFSDLFGKILPVLVSLVDDNSRKTRLYALRAIYLVLPIGKKLSLVNEEHINATYPNVLKRLDDGCDDVRAGAIEALVTVWQALPKDYDLVFSRSHVDYLYTTVIIHFDDPLPKFQSLILDAVLKLSSVHPELLAKKIEKCKANFRNKAGLEKVLNHCYDLLRKTQ